MVNTCRDWEESDEQVTFELQSVAPDKAVFGRLSYEPIEGDQRRFICGRNSRMDRLATKSLICDAGQ
jgi:hypothetical protein|tara:strand:+ start:1588 stop:1788 length:201 start_codon:yes stop_codon:yes gene_type:complete